jgi:hypothetical protein
MWYSMTIEEKLDYLIHAMCLKQNFKIGIWEYEPKDAQDIIEYYANLPPKLQSWYGELGLDSMLYIAQLNPEPSRLAKRAMRVAEKAKKCPASLSLDTILSLKPNDSQL